ncbi:MAG: hypothetical protein QOJ29_5484 [Thermoleophilaceae bacterium]|nr:hypothetical protein [Thermoleophilaceae bacterium]
MHGMVILLRRPKSAVTMRLVCVGYCADHKEDAIGAALDDARGRGQIVMVGSPDVVRPSRQLLWRRSTTSRLAAAAQLLLSSSDAVGEPQPYPVEPVSAPGSAAPARPSTTTDDAIAQ